VKIFTSYPQRPFGEQLVKNISVTFRGEIAVSVLFLDRTVEDRRSEKIAEITTGITPGNREKEYRSWFDALLL
jgi:hypothetical protein